MLRVKVSPPIDFLYSFLQTRGFLLVDDKPNILHYTGDSLKDLKSLLKEDRPDLLILHSKPFIGQLPPDIFWVWHPIKTEKNLYHTKKLYSNSYRLCQTYYQKLGIQAEIQIFPRKKKKKDERKFASPVGRLRSLWSKFCQAMYWK